MDAAKYNTCVTAHTARFRSCADRGEKVARHEIQRENAGDCNRLNYDLSAVCTYRTRGFDSARFTQGRLHAITGYCRYRHSPCGSAKWTFPSRTCDELCDEADRNHKYSNIYIRESLGSSTIQHVGRVHIAIASGFYIFLVIIFSAIWSLRAVLFQFRVVSLKWNLISESLHVRVCVCVCLPMHRCRRNNK